MDYRGQHSVFDVRAIRTYPLSTRAHKVSRADLILPGALPAAPALPPDRAEAIAAVAAAVRRARAAGQPVLVFTGAHLIKNGLGPLLADLIRRRLVTHVAGNGATVIHDLELALVGGTSEHVPGGLAGGAFGMAHEFAYINEALRLGNERRYGFGESLAALLLDAGFRAAVLERAARPDSPRTFAHLDISVIAAAGQCRIPLTVHAGIGTDVIDQHPSFDGEAKGGCSGRDFLIFAESVRRMRQGGVVLNIGSAVTGPEVLLKAVSMAANVGDPPDSIVTADFDLRPADPAAMDNEAAAAYYYRDQKSVVTRIPAAFRGQGFYVQGDQRQTFPALYRALTDG